jgi:hypothetical protein
MKRMEVSTYKHNTVGDVSIAVVYSDVFSGRKGTPRHNN